jgi:hypothetical protein
MRVYYSPCGVAYDRDSKHLSAFAHNLLPGLFRRACSGALVSFLSDPAASSAIHYARRRTMKRLSGFAVLVPVVLVIASAFSLPVKAQRGSNYQSSDRVCFYVDDNYRGASFCANPGESESELRGGWNDRISSIRIFGQASVTVFEDKDYRGSSRTFSRDVPNLRPLGFNDMITSFEVSGGGRQGSGRGDGYGSRRGSFEPRNGACFYVDDDFRGQRFCLNTGESERNVGGRFNDKISSIQIFGRAHVIIFTDANFRGRSREFSRNAQNLRGFNDRITSIQVR